MCLTESLPVQGGTYHCISLLKLRLRLFRGLSEGLEPIFTPLKSPVTGQDLLRAPSAPLALLHRADFNAPSAPQLSRPPPGIRTSPNRPGVPPLRPAPCHLHIRRAVPQVLSALYRGAAKPSVPEPAPSAFSLVVLPGGASGRQPHHGADRLLGLRMVHHVDVFGGDAVLRRLPFIVASQLSTNNSQLSVAA